MNAAQATQRQETSDLAILAKDINAEHDACLLSAADAVTHAIKAGELLIKAKKTLRHGQFMSWVEENCSVDHSQACRYMKLARSNLERAPNLEGPESIRAGLRILIEEASDQSEEKTSELHAWLTKQTEDWTLSWVSFDRMGGVEKLTENMSVEQIKTWIDLLEHFAQRTRSFISQLKEQLK